MNPQRPALRRRRFSIRRRWQGAELLLGPGTRPSWALRMRASSAWAWRSTDSRRCMPADTVVGRPRALAGTASALLGTVLSDAEAAQDRTRDY
jgi:hypothetical protein